MATSTSLVTRVDFVVDPPRSSDASVEFYGTVLGLPCSLRRFLSLASPRRCEGAQPQA